MSHYFEAGFTVRKPAWHGLATVLEDYPGRDEAFVAAGHDFEVIEKPVLILGDVDQVDGWKALVRSDTKKVLHIAKSSYVPIQNKVVWDIMDAVLDQDNVKYETAGVLKEGALVWALARLDEPTKIPGDDSEVYPYVMVSTTHDGSGATRAQAVSIRVVCWNTYSAAEAQAKRSGTQFTFRHTKNVMDRIEDAKSALGLARHQHEAFIELANELAATPVSKDGVNDFVLRFIPEPTANVISDRVRNNIDEARMQVIDLLNGPSVPDAHKRTSYGLWLAGVEYLDHVRRFHNEETHFSRTMLDTSSAKQHVAKLAMAVA